VLIIKDILTVMTDYRHMSGFKLQGQIIQQMLQVVDTPGLLLYKINTENGQEHVYQENKEFAIHLLIESINLLFPNLNKVQIEAFVLNLFNHCANWPSFKSTLRDLLISMKSYSSNNDEFYEDERKVSRRFY
jgi:exportin-1